MTAYSLTPRQREALAFIAAHLRRHGEAPSYRQIAVGLGVVGTSTIARLVEGLIERGALRKCGRSQRSLTLVGEPEQNVLPAHVAARLARYCAQHSEAFDDVLADAVTCFLDERERDLDIDERSVVQLAGGG
jgi:SOS-response transcriptional repressor LexA